jgi:hypothetical protein
MIGHQARSTGIAAAGATEPGDRAMARADRTTVIQSWIDRFRGGDESARSVLLRQRPADAAGPQDAQVVGSCLKYGHVFANNYYSSLTP